MDAVLMGLILGVGILLVVAAVFRVPTVKPSKPKVVRLMSDQITRAALPSLTLRRMMGLNMALVVVTIITVAVWTEVWTVACAIGAVVAPVPWMVISARARKRSAALRKLWPDVVDTLVSGVRSGASLPELVCGLGERGPEELRPAFVRFQAKYHADGRFGMALSDLKTALADPVADRIIEALRLARNVGGSDLTELLSDLARMLRDDARTRGEMEARQTWTVNAARLGVASPWLVLILISTQENAAHAYSTPHGALILAGGALASVIAYLLMLRLGRLPTDQRSLA